MLSAEGTFEYSLPVEMPDRPDQASSLPTTGDIPSHDSQASPSRFLSLPFEIRLKIYSYVLPARLHKVATQIPYTGLFYSRHTLPPHTSQSFYPFDHSASKNLTTYKVLTSNHHTDFPHLSIHPDVLRTCKQVREEAEPVLYSGKDVCFDFGECASTVSPFWRDRSQLARDCVRWVKIAREIPDLTDNGTRDAVHPDWTDLCGYLMNNLTGLKTLDLTIWTNQGSMPSPVLSSGAAITTLALNNMPGPERPAMDQDFQIKKNEEIKRWQEWEWTHSLLQIPALQHVRVTWWATQWSNGGDNQSENFGAWIASRMSGDRLLKNRLISNGVVVEGLVILPVKSV